MLVGIARTARHALRAIQLFRTWRNRMNRQGARVRSDGFHEERVAASGALRRKSQSSCAERHRSQPMGGGDGPPASARRYCAEKGVRPELGLSSSRCFASLAQSVPLGTPTGVLHSLKEGGRRAELSERAGQKTVEVSQGGAALLAAFFAYFLSHHRK